MVFNFHVSHEHMLLLFRNLTFPLTLSPTILNAHSKLHQGMVFSCKSYNVKDDNVCLENVKNFVFGKGRGK